MGTLKGSYWRWDVGLALAVALLVALNVPAAALKEASGELVTFFGIQAAAILPAMLLTATILRPEGLSPLEVKRYRGALHGQMVFWSVLLGLDFVAAGLVIAGKVTSWAFPTLFVPFRGWTDVSRLIIGFTAFVGSLAIIRMIHAVRGIFSLMKVNLDLVGKSVGDRITKETEERKREATPFVPPKRYGRVVEPPKLQ